jgi:ABC-type ATPase involved in cell division
MIELSAVCKTYRGTRATAVLTGIDLRVGEGEVVLVSGCSGAGKSTLLGILHASIRPDSGSVRLFERDLFRLQRSSIVLLRRRVALVPQEISLLVGRTTFENVALTGEVAGLSRAETRLRTLDALAMVALDALAPVPVAELSTGERRRVAIARALAADPILLLADEPGGDLDDNRRDELCGVLEELRRRGKTCIVTTNDAQLFEAGALCGWRAVELRAGLLHERALGFSALAPPFGLRRSASLSVVPLMATGSEG